MPSMANSSRIVFTFDQTSRSTLERVKTIGKFNSFGETVREALCVYAAIQEQKLRGFTDLAVINPETNEEKLLVRR